MPTTLSRSVEKVWTNEKAERGKRLLGAAFCSRVLDALGAKGWPACTMRRSDTVTTRQLQLHACDAWERQGRRRARSSGQLDGKASTWRGAPAGVDAERELLLGCTWGKKKHSAEPVLDRDGLVRPSVHD